MLSNSTYVDIQGQMEDVFDSKIAQINIITEENLKDQIEEKVSEIVIQPEVFDDVYAKKDHSHSSFNNLTVNGLLIYDNMESNNGIFKLSTGTNYDGYAAFQTIHDTGGTIFFRQFDTNGKQRSNLVLLDSSCNTSLPGNLTVNGNKLSVNGYDEKGWGPVLRLGHLELCNNRRGTEASYIRMASDTNTNIIDIQPKTVRINASLNVNQDTFLNKNLNVKDVLDANTSQTTITSQNLVITSDTSIANHLDVGGNLDVAGETNLNHHYVKRSVGV